jgi:hypothetical protein
VLESPYRAQSLRDHSVRVNGIFSGVCSHWFVEHVALIRIPPQLSCSVTHIYSVLHFQYCLAALAPGAYSISVRSAYTAYTLSVAGGIYCSRPNLDAWHLFYFLPICDTCTVLPFQYPCIANACPQVPDYVDVTTPSSTSQ